MAGTLLRGILRCVVHRQALFPLRMTAGEPLRKEEMWYGPYQHRILCGLTLYR